MTIEQLKAEHELAKANADKQWETRRAAEEAAKKTLEPFDQHWQAARRWQDKVATAIEVMEILEPTTAAATTCVCQ